MICYNCKTKCSKGLKFCPVCGKSFHPVTCPRCGSKVLAGFKFCPKCGSEIGMEAVPYVSPIVKVGNWFSFRRLGSILTLISCILVLVFPLDGIITETAVVFIVIRCICGIFGLFSKSRAPAIILLCVLVVQLIGYVEQIVTTKAEIEAYYIEHGVRFAYGGIEYIGLALWFSLFLLSAAMMLVTPRKYKNYVSIAAD